MGCVRGYVRSALELCEEGILELYTMRYIIGYISKGISGGIS